MTDTRTAGCRRRDRKDPSAGGSCTALTAGRSQQSCGSQRDQSGSSGGCSGRHRHIQRQHTARLTTRAEPRQPDKRHAEVSSGR